MTNMEMREGVQLRCLPTIGVIARRPKEIATSSKDVDVRHRVAHARLYY
jgi:hypothetical protein